MALKRLLRERPLPFPLTDVDIRSASDEDLVALFEAEGFTVASRNLTLVEQRRMSAPEVAHYLKRSYLPALAKKGTSVDEQAMLSQAKEALSERPLPWRVHLLFLEARLS